jgi:phage shock protein PspC (stress-responsive transcriptional regulator)
MRAGGTEATWSWDGGVRRISENGEVTNLGAGGMSGLIVISVVSGLVSGVAEALGLSFTPFSFMVVLTMFFSGCRAWFP